MDTRDRSHNDWFPSGYEAPVTRRVVTKCLRGTGHRASGFQVAARHKPQDDFPSGYETSGYEVPDTRRVVSKS